MWVTWIVETRLTQTQMNLIRLTRERTGETSSKKAAMAFASYSDSRLSVFNRFKVWSIEL